MHISRPTQIEIYYVARVCLVSVFCSAQRQLFFFIKRSLAINRCIHTHTHTYIYTYIHNNIIRTYLLVYTCVTIPVTDRLRWVTGELLECFFFFYYHYFSRNGSLNISVCAHDPQQPYLQQYTGCPVISSQRRKLNQHF